MESDKKYLIEINLCLYDTNEKIVIECNSIRELQIIVETFVNQNCTTETPIEFSITRS